MKQAAVLCAAANCVAVSAVSSETVFADHSISIFDYQIHEKQSRRISLLTIFLENITGTIISIFSSMRIIDVFDIAVVTFAVYKIIQFLRSSRAMQIFNGLLLLVVAMIVSGILGFHTVNFLLSNGLRYGLMAILVIFFPELRRALEYLGRKKLIFSRLESDEKTQLKAMIQQIIDAVDYFSSNKVGALIVLEKEVALGDILEHGTIVDADVSAMLLETLFFEGTTLHDGAVIIRNRRVYAAGCVLPLSSNKNLEKSLGTRHRAGLGITEVSDAVSIMVSEESGIISTASEGKLSRFLEIKSVEKLLYATYNITGMETARTYGVINSIFGRKSNEQ